MAALTKSHFSNAILDEAHKLLTDLQKYGNPEIKKELRHINNGYCADFSHYIWERFNRDERISIYSDEDLGRDEYTHSFLEFDGLYYDAECPEGVEDWTQLPIFLRQQSESVEW